MRRPVADICHALGIPDLWKMLRLVCLPPLVQFRVVYFSKTTWSYTTWRDGVAVCVLCQMASVVRGLFGSEHSLLVCASVGAVVYVVCGDAWPILLSPCNTAWSNAPRKVCNTTWAYTA